MRLLTAAVAMASGLIVLLGYFYPLEMLIQLRVMLTDWAVIIAAMAVLVGIINLIFVHMDKIRKREKNSIYGVLLVLSLLALSSSLFYGVAALGVVIATLAVFGVGLLYFGVYSRHHLVASAPEEEAALIEAAERELDGR